MANEPTGRTVPYRTKLCVNGIELNQLSVLDTNGLDQQCYALRNDLAELDVLSFTEAAAGEIEGWK